MTLPFQRSIMVVVCSLIAVAPYGCGTASSSAPSPAPALGGSPETPSGAAQESVEAVDEERGETPVNTEVSAAPVAESEQPSTSGVDPDQILDISFADLELQKMEADSKFDPSMLTDRVKELDGRRVRIRGFIHPGTTFQLKNITQFLMIKQSNCPFGKGGTAFHNMKVVLPENAGADFTTKAIAVEGTLQVKPWEGPDGNTWYLYEMDAERVK